MTAPHSHLPYGPEGAGCYSDYTLGCFDVIQQASQLCLDAIDSIPFSGTGAFLLADFAAADGGTSMPLIKLLLDQLRKKHGKKFDIEIIYEDQPSNDWTSLFYRMQGVIPKPESYLIAHPDVRVFASGTSFYKQCFSGNSLHFGFSSTGMHWLSKRPCTITGAVHFTGITVPEEKEKFKRQAAEDWATILVNRAKELQPGGRMVIANFTVDKENQYLGNTKRVKCNMFQIMTDKWRALVDKGIITAEEFQNTTINNYYRTEKEITAPLTDVESPVYKLGLRLVSIETKVVNCYFHVRWLESGRDDDADAVRAHARSYVRTIRTWSNSSFLSGLSDCRTPEEKAAIVDAFFQSYEDDVARNPRDHAMDYVHTYTHLRKLEE
ncbi:PREDICTED: salicylate carboxymethyltransferase-like [Priapulus caudatus]|uniref:Salicylate carboxymethyltransferase-like n=1 Tax=Priapulus caudatus TaxID=37621 RepID=A0ABM1F0P9_PRICU|nr:PREDICTED: salicylate carboxymethyltransferase-like [Priapulus caudatus]